MHVTPCWECYLPATVEPLTPGKANMASHITSCIGTSSSKLLERRVACDQALANMSQLHSRSQNILQSRLWATESVVVEQNLPQ